VSTRHKFSGPLERLAARAVTSVATSVVAHPPAPPATLDPDTLVKALNFALLGSGSRAFLWRSAGQCVVVSDTYSADGNCRFTEVLHLNNLEGRSRIDVQQYQLKYSDRSEECVEAQSREPESALRESPSIR
jgi:hypothetical protein